MIELNDSFEIPQFQPQLPRVTDPDEEAYLNELLEEVTPQLPKRQRLRSKQGEADIRHRFLKAVAASRFQDAADVNVEQLRGVGKGKGQSKQVSHDLDNPEISSEEFGMSDSDFALTKREKRAKDKADRLKHAIAAASTASPAHTRKTAGKIKKP